MPATFIGVRHHSPACARLVAATIRRLRPAYVLVEGPADVNDRLDELLLGHDLPIAVFSAYRDRDRVHAGWTPFCEHSPEWVALTVGRDVGAQVRLVDLPSWHSALAGRRNRYADAERRYADAVERLCAAFVVDNVDALWDHLFESAAPGDPDDSLDEWGAHLAAYFDALRGDCDAGPEDTAREAYMADWVVAALARAGDRPVVVVTGGFHRPALVRLVGRRLAGRERADAPAPGWPEVPGLPAGAHGGSHLVPYSFRRLNAFDGYQAGMPSPGYYQRLWEVGPAEAADGAVAAVVERLRERRHVVSTADLVVARATVAGLARLRGHRHPTRMDVLDGLLTALVSEPLDVAPPWTGRASRAGRGRGAPGTHPAVAEMIAVFGGDRVGRLHPDTPAPPLVHDVTAELERHGLADPGDVRLDLTVERDLARSRVLHRLRVLTIPGFDRRSGPATGVDPVLAEQWRYAGTELPAPPLIEAGAYGATLLDAATAALEERVGRADGGIEELAAVLFDAALCGVGELPARVLEAIGRAIGRAVDVGGLGRVLATVLDLWRHDRLLGTARTAPLGAALAAGVARLLWLLEGVRGPAAGADVGRLAAVVAVRDAIVHAGPALGLSPGAAVAVMSRLARDDAAPTDLRGAGFGFCWSLAGPSLHRSGPWADVARAVRGAAPPTLLGDWLAGLFALARERVLDGEQDVVGVLDEVVAAMAEHDFLLALPGLRQAFAFFPPRERELIARQLLERRGLTSSGRSVSREDVGDAQLRRGRALEAQVDAMLARGGLLDGKSGAVA
ncbi:DUF5682 family protein [Micromonospora sp. RTGN7]|uniref:DUF5682 family protein n=1 Tax=Micromonospora sp. RTGN7 TaxID=3016526 RepID=UPI0029FEE6CE|nr:DUF5682 family protein [Micromonospora sp. RTGN7]